MKIRTPAAAIAVAVFIPDYRDGQAPFGIWTPAQMLVAPQWISSSDPNLDVGFVVLNPTSRQSATQLRFDCGGYTGGTSGSPWVTNFSARTRTGTIVGVVGGYQQGGDTPAVSYSSYLGDAVHEFYQQAVAAEPSSAG